jgi:hypothetical protein
MSDIIEVIKDITTVTIASDGPQGPAGPTGPTGPEGAAGAPGSSGVISVVAPITNTGTSTSAIIGINSGVANGVATLDSNGKVPQSQIPAVAITNTFVVASQAAMLALTAEEGDVAVRTDQNKTYILTAPPSSTLANWQELLTPTDTVSSVDGRIGTVTLTDLYAGLATANTFTGGVQQITTASAATKGFIVKATASQSANLTEWQSSASVVLTSINSNGSLRIRSTDTSLTSAVISPSSAGQIGLTVQGFASQTANLQDWRDSAGTLLTRITSAGVIRQDMATAANDTRFVAFTQYIGADATLGAVIVEMGANPSATGASRYGFLSVGDGSAFRNFVFFPGATANTNGRVGISNTAPAAKLHVGTGTAATVGAIVQGAASQTANLQEWQNSAGTVLARVSSAGEFYVSDGLSSYFSTNTSYSASVNIQPASTSFRGLVIRGRASQTANLQEWQDSSGNILAQISSAGAVTLRANDGADNHRTIITVNTSGVIFNSTRSAGAACNFIIQTANVERFIVTENGTAQFTNVAAAAVAVVIQGAASQTADLQQWRSSTPTTLTTITAAGTINFASGNTSATANTGAVALPALAVGFITMQVAGTTVKVPYYAN